MLIFQIYHMNLIPIIYNNIVSNCNTLVSTICSSVFINEFEEPIYGSIFPNPTAGNINIKFPTQLINEKISVTIFNSFGNEISSALYNWSPHLELEINIASGLYFVRVVADDKSRVYKIFKL